MSVDQQIINDAILCHRRGKIIDNLEAKVIANVWHGGQSSPLYSFTSTGTITDALRIEIQSCQVLGKVVEHPIDEELDALLAYVKEHGERGTVPGWSEISW